MSQSKLGTFLMETSTPLSPVTPILDGDSSPKISWTLDAVDVVGARKAMKIRRTAATKGLVTQWTSEAIPPHQPSLYLGTTGNDSEQLGTLSGRTGRTGFLGSKFSEDHMLHPQVVMI